MAATRKTVAQRPLEWRVLDRLDQLQRDLDTLYARRARNYRSVSIGAMLRIAAKLEELCTHEAMASRETFTT